MRSPETFRSEAGQSMAVTDDSIVLRLLPFAVFRIDSHHGGEDGC
jgi:hypothetical protein